MNLDGSKIVINLKGSLATKLKRASWTFHVFSPAEALQALEVCSDGDFSEALFSDIFASYNFLLNGKSIQDHRELFLGPVEGTLDMYPVLKGSSNDNSGWLAIVGIVIIAIVLIATAGTAAPGAAATVSGWTALTTTGYSLTATASFFLTLGVSLTLSGLAALISPNNAIDSSEKPQNSPSYLYNGPINTYRQGNPVQVGFGLLIIGSQTISGGIRNVDYVQGNQQYEYDFIEQPTIVNPASDLPSPAPQLVVPAVIETSDPSSLNVPSEPVSGMNGGKVFVQP